MEIDQAPTELTTWGMFYVRNHEVEEYLRPAASEDTARSPGLKVWHLVMTECEQTCQEVTGGPEFESRGDLLFLFFS